MGLIRAFINFFRAIKQAITGRTNATADAVMQDPYATRQEFNDIIQARRQGIAVRETSFQRLCGILAKDQQGIKDLLAEVEKKRRIVAGAEQLAKKRLAELRAQGLAEDAIKADPELAKLRASWADRTSSLKQLEEDVQKKREAIVQLENDLSEQERDILAAGREIDDLEKERERTVDDVQRGKDMATASAQARGVGVDGTAERLRKLREMRTQAVGQQIGARRLMGTDAVREDAKLMEAAHDAEFGDAFDKMLFGEKTASQSKTASSADPVVKETSPLPEA